MASERLRSSTVRWLENITIASAGTPVAATSNPLKVGETYMISPKQAAELEIEIRVSTGTTMGPIYWQTAQGPFIFKVLSDSRYLYLDSDSNSDIFTLCIIDG